MSERNCDWCGGFFTPRKRWQRFCRVGCKRDFERAQRAAAKTISGETVNGKNPAAVALGKLGAAARNASMTPEQRSESARRASLARVEKRKRDAHAHTKGA